MKPCLDCGAATKGSVCPTCRAQREAVRDAARGTTAQRGYGAEHQAERRRWQIRIAHGEPVLCARCHQPVTDPSDFDLGHTDDRDAWTGPEHTVCNRGAANRK